MRTSSVLRVVAWLGAIAFVAASALYVGLALDLFAQPPDLPPTTDFVERLLSGGDFARSIWPIDMASSLLYALAFLMIALLARPLVDLGTARDPRGSIAASALLVAGVVGITAQLIYVGARQTQLGIAYCDCGYKVQEVISQNWSMWLIEGAVGWLTNGSGVAAVIGVVAAGAALGGSAMPSGWRLLSWLIGAVLALSVTVGVLGIEGSIGPLLIGLETGILIPIWLIWIAVQAPRGIEPAPTETSD
jgi:hypothetical protein